MKEAPLPDETVAVIGLGYVGLPLAASLARAGFPVIGFDVDCCRVQALRQGYDATGEVGQAALRSPKLRFTASASDLGEASFLIIAVPTPVDEDNCPDLTALRAACASVGAHLRPGAAVVIESTVYPGATEEVCRPAIEAASGLCNGDDFVLGYSPERINPGDGDHGIGDIIKVVAGQDQATLERVAAVYGRIAHSGLHRAPSITVAETAKVIENAQRDLNIALMNELAKICHLMEIRTSDVLAAARTKWNFLGFHPGLVGGHCIGVDPYYVTAKAQRLGYYPEVILAGRRINSGMGAYIANQLARLMAVRGVTLSKARVGILGLTFKENVRDLRNSAVRHIVASLRGFGIDVFIHDPLADADQVTHLFGVMPSALSDLADLDGLILAVPHRAYEPLCARQLTGMFNHGGVFVDVRSRFDATEFPGSIAYWSL